MCRTDIVCQTLIHRQRALDLADELAQLSGFAITRQASEGLRNRVQLVIAS
jgi:hypothetical protein